MAPKLKLGHAKRRSTSPITATYSYDNPAPTAAIAPQTFSSNPKPGHAKRRSTSNIAATYSYDDPATPTAATSPQTFSFDTSACAAVTGATPLAYSPAAAPVVRPPSAAAAPEGHYARVLRDAENALLEKDDEKRGARRSASGPTDVPPSVGSWLRPFAAQIDLDIPRTFPENPRYHGGASGGGGRASTCALLKRKGPNQV